MKVKGVPLFAPLLGSIALLIPAQAVEITKLQNTNALNSTTAWTGGVIPGLNDVMVWNNIYSIPGATTTLSPLGGDLSVFGLKVTDVGGTRNLATTMVGFQNPSSANTLTIGAGGIDLATATQGLFISSKVTLGANQNWVIGNANTNGNPMGFNNNEDLGFGAQAAAAFNFGGNTVTTSGAGQVTISSGYTLSSGTLNVGNNLFVIQGGGNRLTTINNTLTMNVAAGSTLRLQSNSGALTSSAPINLNGGTLNVLVNNGTNAVTMNGNVNVLASSAIAITSAANGPAILNGNLTGSANLAITNTTGDAARFLQLAGNNSGYSGTVTLGGTAGRVTRLNAANSGSAAATWVVNSGHTLQVAGVNVALGTLNGAGAVASSSGAGTITVNQGDFSGSIGNGAGTLALTKIGSGTLKLTGANSYTGATTVSAGTLSVVPGALTGTVVNVAAGATYLGQSSFAGFLDTVVNVADGGTISSRPEVSGAGITVPVLNAGTATGGNILLDTGVLGNPTAPLLTATTFNPVAGTTIRVIGSNLSPGTFPAVGYTTIGGGGFAGLTLALPFRVSGSLIDNPGVSVDVNITGTAKPVWKGTIDGNWNIDTVGDGSVGTANWSASSGPNTYVEALVGRDSVVFDDSATGPTNVTLTTTLSPGGISVTNSAKNYAFIGAGRLSGTGAITKTGTGTLTLANAGNNDYSGGTFIDDGIVSVGDGVTVGAGSVGSGTVTVNLPGTLQLNRPDDFTLANALAGSGGLRKLGANTATISGATNLNGPIELNGGALRSTGGGNLGGPITGTGELRVGGGTLQLSGVDANTYSGLTTISAGTLQLNKSGVEAIGGDVLINGTGGLTLLQPNQIIDTAIITYDKPGANLGTVILGNDTVGSVRVLNGADAGSQVQGTTGLVIANDLTISNTGLFAVASGHSVSTGSVVMNGTPVLRIAGNSNASTLTVGAGGITASGGTIQIGQGTGAFDAVLNLEGDVTTTGNLAITDGGFVGLPKRELNLGASDRVFTIGAGTTTTIAPDIAGTGGLIKAGAGTLQLTAASASTYTGPTNVLAGALLTTTAQTGATSVIVGGGATFGVTILNGGESFATTDVTTGALSTLQLATGGTGNPFAPVLTTGALTIGGGTVLRLTGTALTSGTDIPLIGYSTISGFGNLSAIFPSRMTGTLVNNTIDQRVDVNLSVEQARWNGSVNGNWDIDPAGDGVVGTANWRTTLSNAPTTYFQGPPVTTDTANFTDAATGTTTVNLTTGLSPIAAVVNNDTKTYTFTGAGRLTGATALTKSGPGTLILANSIAYNHTGGTTITEGVLQVGDGVTPGVGILPTTPVTNDARLVLNRPDDFGIAAAITGLGTLVKDNANTATISAATNYNGTVEVNAGTLRFAAAGNLFGPATVNGGTLVLANGGAISGALTGAGNFEAAGGTVQLNGADANTISGSFSVTNGTLQLNKSSVDAVPGNITISGGGVLAILGSEQINDSATINFIGTSTDSTVGSTGTETVANLIANPPVATGQFLLRNNFTVTGLATLNQGVLGVASGHTTVLNSVNMTGGLLRIAGNTGPSSMDIGPGGFTASGGEVQVKFNTNDFDAVLNLSGDYTATGNVAFTNAGYTGVSQNVINLIGQRTFDIAAGTTTTIAPDLGGAGGLTKSGAGTLNLLGTVLGTYAGPTVIEGGTLSVGGEAIPDTGAVTIDNTPGALLLLTLSETIGSLSGGGEVQLGAHTLTTGDATNTTYSGHIVGAGGVTKTGAGVFTLTGAQDYAFLTTNAGVTNVNGSFTAGNTVVNADATTNFGASQTLASLNIGAGDVVTLTAPPAEILPAPAVAPVPEPGLFGLLLTGALGLLGRRRR